MEKINFSEELGGFDRRMVEARWRDRWKSFILLLAREKKKDGRTIPPLCFPRWNLPDSRLVSTISLNKLDERLSRAIYYTTGVRTGVTGD